MVRRMRPHVRCVVAVLDEVGEIGEQLIEDEFTVTHLGRGAGIDLRCARQLQDLCEREHVDILHAHQYTPFFQSMLSRGLTGQRPVVFTEHGRHFPDCPGPKRILANRLLLRRRDRLIACGEAVRDALIHKEGLPVHRVEVIYNGVDLDALAQPSPAARQSVRREFGFQPQDFVIVQIARLHRLKDHSTALRTMDVLRQSVPSARLLLVGDGEEREAIVSEIRERKLEHHVRLAGTRSDIADHLAASDAFLLTSISEGIPLTVIEAMAARRPVVATSVGGLPEMVQPNLNGYLAEPGDAEGLADGLRRLHADACLREGMGTAGSHIARETFSLERMLNAYSDVYDEVLQTISGRFDGRLPAAAELTIG